MAFEARRRLWDGTIEVPSSRSCGIAHNQPCNLQNLPLHVACCACLGLLTCRLFGYCKNQWSRSRESCFGLKAKLMFPALQAGSYELGESVLCGHSQKTAMSVARRVVWPVPSYSRNQCLNWWLHFSFAWCNTQTSLLNFSISDYSGDV